MHCTIARYVFWCPYTAKNAITDLLIRAARLPASRFYCYSTYVYVNVCVCVCVTTCTHSPMLFFLAVSEKCTRRYYCYFFVFKIVCGGLWDVYV